MKKFKYKFDSVLNFKDSIKKQAMKEVADVRKLIDKTETKRKKKIDELSECKLSNNSGVMKISDLQFFESHIFYLKKKIGFHDSELSRLKLLLKMKQNELIGKTKESKIFHKLKEAKLIQFRKEENKIELNMLDELAIQKSNRE